MITLIFYYVIVDFELPLPKVCRVGFEPWKLTTTILTEFRNLKLIECDPVFLTKKLISA